MKFKVILFLATIVAGFSSPSWAQYYPRSRDSGSYPFGYRSPYQGGFNGYGTFYGRGYQQYDVLPRYSPYGYGPSRLYPSYQPYLNPYYQPVYPYRFLR
jgi:hypothetical protein